MTRVHFHFLATLMLVFAILLAGCGGAPAAPPVAQEPAAQEPPPAADSETAAEIPGVEFTQQVVYYNTIADYEAATGNEITSFQQSPMLDALVADGTLPPVEERLPDEPLVLQPADRIGEYGGTVRNSHEGNFDFLEDLLREFPHMYGSNMQGVLPNVFMSYEVSDDAHSYTFNIRPGIKWSDGHPFGADDFVFWYEAIALNTELNPNGISDLKAGGEMGTVTKVDDYTIVMEFVAPYGILPERLNRWREVPYAPAHYLQQFHPDYTDADELDALVADRGFSNWTELFESEWDWYGNPDIPTIFAWKTLTRGASVPVQELERNPYYWKVDIAGNQLPYIDRVNRPNLGDREAILLDVLSGENDYQDPYTLGYITNYPVLKQNEATGGYRILPQYGWSDVLGTITFNMSIDDPVLRELFNNKDFRIALSIGYDRNEINEVVFNGLYTPSQPAPPDESVYNGADPAFKQYIEHDPDRANEILDSLGLTWNSDRTQRLLPDGRPFELTVLVNTSWVQQVPIAELIAQGWEDLGLNAILRPQASNLIGELMLAGDYQLTITSVNWGGQAPIIGAVRGQPVPIVSGWPINPPWAQWVITDGAEGEEPPDDVKRLYEIFEEFVAEPDLQKRFELETEMYAIHNENMWIIGSIKQPADLEAVYYAVFSNRMYNIPNPVAPEWYYAVPSTWALQE
jgi:peptide/nickel transport system substrate-binding protein